MRSSITTPERIINKIESGNIRKSTCEVTQTLTIDNTKNSSLFANAVYTNSGAPNIPFFASYNGCSDYMRPLALQLPNHNFLPDAVTNYLAAEAPASATDYFFLVQNRPRYSKEPLSLRSHAWAHASPDIPDGYNISERCQAAIFSQGGEGLSLKDSDGNVHVHPGQGGLVASPNNFNVQGLEKDETKIFYTVVTNLRTRKKAVTQHILLSSEDFISFVGDMRGSFADGPVEFASLKKEPKLGDSAIIRRIIKQLNLCTQLTASRQASSQSGNSGGATGEQAYAQVRTLIEGLNRVVASYKTCFLKGASRAQSVQNIRNAIADAQSAVLKTMAPEIIESNLRALINSIQTVVAQDHGANGFTRNFSPFFKHKHSRLEISLSGALNPHIS